MKKQSSLSKKKQAKKVAKPVKKTVSDKPQTVTPDLSGAYILKGNSLQLPGNEHPPAVERKFQSENELRQLVLKNLSVLFGDTTLAILPNKDTLISFSNGFTADAFLFHFVEGKVPKFYLLKILFSKTRLLQIFYETTPVFAFLKDRERTGQLTKTIHEQLCKDKALKQKFTAMYDGADLLELLNRAMSFKPSILFVSDAEFKYLPALMQSYPEEWGKVCKRMVIKKYASNGDILFSIEPDFSEITRDEKPKKESRKDEPKLTEAEHLEKASGVVREIYGKIKAELLKIDKGLEFRSTNYYVSVHRNGRKIAVFHIRKSNVSIVMLNPIKDTKKLIKHYRIADHTESVQKFWGGECCTLVIQTAEHLGEVIGLFQKMLTKA